jgi:protoheme ferro-lyase
MKIMAFWVISALLALACGVFYLAYLVASPLQMSLYLALLVGSIIFWGLLAWRSFRGWALAADFGLLLVLFAVGYLGATLIYLAQTEERKLPAITRQVGDPGDGHTAILYFTHGEPPAYSPMPWIETFHELDKDGVSFVPWLFRPFFLSNVRREYLAIGGSAHNKVHQIMLHSLILSLPEKDRREMRFYQAFLDSPPRPDQMAIQAINEGASELIVLPVFLTESSHTVAGSEMIQVLDLEKYGVKVCEAKPLWPSEALQQMFVARADAHLNSVDKDKVGILLVGHGQPNDWDAIYPTQTEQENEFRARVKDRLIQAGYLSDNVLLAWMEFKSPKITPAVQQLAAQGVERILVFSASISADSIHSDIQVPEAVEAAHLPGEIQVVNMGGWGNSPLVIEAIRQSINECQP